MLARNADRVNSLAGYLLANATSTHGKTVKEIQEAFGISGTAVRNIIYKYPSFRTVAPAKYPTEYWFDLDRAQNVTPDTSPILSKKKDKNTGAIIEIFKTYVGEFRRKEVQTYDPTKTELFINMTLQSEHEAKQALEKGLQALNMARRMSREFKVTGRLDKTEWEKVLQDIAGLRNGVAQIAEFLDFLLTDPRINTPEYWTVFLDTVKD